MKLTLQRLEESEDGTFGALLIDGHVFCVTLEPPDKDNQQNISNIPPNTYVIVRTHSNKYGVTFEITGIPGRTRVLIHAGNIVSHTKGCVILGQYWDKLKGDRAVLNSGNTFRKFMKLMEGIDEAELTILDPVTPATANSQNQEWAHL